ncbi:hypothetical protein LXL04_034126 [Taraxacum kok-saghyz]
MASGSFSSSNGVDIMLLMMNSQQESNLVQPTSLVSSQHYHHVAPMQQINGPLPLCKFFNFLLFYQIIFAYPNADMVVALSPNTLLDGNRFVCQICYKGFQRVQNLTLHRRVHNLPFNLKRRTPKDVVPRKVYLLGVSVVRF